MRKFDLGDIVMTRTVNDMVAENEQFAKEVMQILRRYKNCDWGDLDKSDWQMNDRAIEFGNDRILAAYRTSQGKTYVITEYDESVNQTRTTLLFADEY